MPGEASMDDRLGTGAVPPAERAEPVPRAQARRLVGAAALGNALEFYDFIVYAFFAIQIGHAFFPTESAYGSLMLSLATFGAGFVTRPLGGIVIGAYSDRAGRRPAMMLSFTLMGAAAVGLALVPSYATIGLAAPILAISARMVQGFSLGGAVGSTTAFMLEAAPVERRGLMVSWQSASQNIAATAGGVVGVVLAAVMTPAALDAYGWRIAFLLGAVTLPFGLWVRTALPETLHAHEPHAATQSTAETTFGLLRENSRIIVLGLTVLAGGTISTYVANYMTTFAEDTLHMAAGIAFGATVASNLLGFVAALYGGWLSDHLGRRPVMIWFNLAYLVLIYPVFYWIVSSRSAVPLLGGLAVLTFLAQVAFGAFYAALTESLPKRIRGGAFSVIYASSIALFGGTTQLVITWLIHVSGSPLAPAWYLLGATLIMQIAMRLILESAPSQRARAASLAA